MAQPTPDPPGAAHDPSMEDILASIRRILSEDEANAADKPAPATHPAHQTPAYESRAQESRAHDMPADDVLVLHEDMMVPEPVPPDRVQPELVQLEPAQPEPVQVEPVSQQAPPPSEPPRVAAEPAPEPARRPDLVAPAAAEAAASSVGSLMRMLAQERSTAVHRGGPTLEDLVRDEMRPLLKEWFDVHLPPLVERLVRAEIERVVGRAAL